MSDLSLDQRIKLLAMILIVSKTFEDLCSRQFWKALNDPINGGTGLD